MKYFLSFPNVLNFLFYLFKKIGSVFNDPIDSYINGFTKNPTTGVQTPLKHNAAVTFYIAVGKHNMLVYWPH